MSPRPPAAPPVDSSPAPEVDAVTVRHLGDAIRPLLERTGGQVVASDEARPTDLVLTWDGLPALRVRLPGESGDTPGDAPADLSDGLARLIGEVERELGSALADLPRADKQRAVRLLEERGAFEMRRSAETVAEALGVTRFTVYNYLNRS